MVGMSGKASEPRSGATGSSKKQPSVPGGHSRTQPPQEALQMARILDDSVRQVSVSELDQLIAEVLLVASGKSSEEASIALHDNNFDVEKAITVLLDMENGSSTGEWTTTGRNRKKRDGFKSGGDSDQIVAPGDSKTAKSKGLVLRGSTNKAASASTREGYGGSVTVSAEGIPRAPPKGGRGNGGGQGGRGQEGRGRSQSGRRPMDKTKTSNSDRERRRDRASERGADHRSDKPDRADRIDHGERVDRGHPAERGEFGDRGVIRPGRGNRDDRGDRNDRGDRGNHGDRGDRGNHGDRGDRGNHGDRGDRGNHGDRGDRGNHGDRGDRGNHGDRGDRGNHGDRVDRVNYGDRGDRGNHGDKGDRGNHGDRGNRGDRPEGRRERRDRNDDRRERRGDRERNGEERRDRGDRGSGFGGRKGGRQRQRDRNEKPWESASSHPILPLEMGGAINKQKAPASTILWGEGKESWDIAGPTHLEKEEVSSHSWDQQAPVPENSHTTPSFPDALPTSPSTYQPHPQMPALSTAAETTHNLTSLGETSERTLVRAEATEQRVDQTASKSSNAVSVAPAIGSGSAGNPQRQQKKSKRLARSRIPTTPVEMPKGVETLDLQFGRFGIGFIGLDQQQQQQQQQQQEEAVATPTTLAAPASSDFSISTDRPAMYSEMRRLADDPSVLGVIATASPPSQILPMDLPSPVGVAQSYPTHSTTEQRPNVGPAHRGDQGGGPMGGSTVHRIEAAMEPKEAPLDGPPGLPRPTTVPGVDSAKSSQQSLSSSQQSLASSQQQSQQQQHLPLSVTTSVSPSTSSAGSSSLPSGGGMGEAGRNSVSMSMQTPEPLDMPHQQSAMSNAHQSQNHYQLTPSTSDLLMSSVTSAATSASTPSSVGMASGSTSTSSALARSSGGSSQHGSHASSTQHSLQQQQQAAKQLPGMMYPSPMIPQYPFSMLPMYAAAAHSYPDPSDMSRQFPVSMPYYSSSEHSLAPSSTYGGGVMADHGKYIRGGSDGSTPVTSQQQQSQQQQQHHHQQAGQQGSGSGIQQGHLHTAAHFMNNHPYTFYSPYMYMPPHGGFSGPHNLPPKPSGSGSNMSNYQHHHGSSSSFGTATGSAGSYEDMMPGGPSAGSTTHDQFASKIYGSALSKSGIPSTGGDMGSGLGGGASSAFSKQHFEGSKSMGGSANSYNYGLGNQYHLGYMGMHTMPIPHMATAATQVMPGGGGHDNAGGGVVTRSALPPHGGLQKHGSKTGYQSSGGNLWPQS